MDIELLAMATPVTPTGQAVQLVALVDEYEPAAHGAQLLSEPDCVHTLVTALLVQASVGVPA